MSDNWNPPPEREPADGDQPAGPPEQPAGDGQSPTWWSEAKDAKREFQDPGASQGERPANNWFGEGWTNRPEDPDQDPTWQTHPAQSRPDQPGRNQYGPAQPGATQSGPGQTGPRQPGPAQSGPQPGPTAPGPGRPGPAWSGPNQPGPTQPGPAWSSPNQPGTDQAGANQSGQSQSGASQSGTSQPGASQRGPQPGPGQSGPNQPGTDQAGPGQGSSWQSAPTYGSPAQPPQGGPHQGPGPQQGPGPRQGAGPTQGGPGPHTGAPQTGRPQSGEPQSNWPSSGRPQSGGPQSNWPSSGGPQSGGPQSGGAQSGGAQSGGAQSSWPQGGPQSGGPQSGGAAQDGGQSAGTGAYSESSYLWGPSSQGPSTPQPQSPWSNALPPNKQGGPRHAAQRGQQGGQIGPMGQPVQQAPTWQYPPIPIPQPPGGGRRRKQKSRTRALLIGVVVLAVLVVGSGVMLLVRSFGDEVPQTTNTPSTQPSESPSASPSESPTQASATPSTPAAPTVDELVTASKLYTVGPIAASKCAEPPFAPINFTAARNYYNRLSPCLNRTWMLAMKKAGVPFRAPKVAVYAGKLSSPCGMQRSVRAAYCGANETIYLPFAVDNRYYTNNPVYARAIMLNTFAHEYGHHVQNLTGILAASVTRQQKMSPNQKLLESRRRELQATCLGAAYLGANAAFIPMRNPLLANWRFLIAHTGDDYARPRVHDHGNRVSNYQWSIAGYNSKQPNSCNTFTATEARVA